MAVMADDQARKAGSRMLAPLVALTMMAGINFADASAPLRIVALGTSLTARGGWPEPLARALEACGDRRASISVMALPGATSSWGREQVGRALDADPDLVLVEFAVNDAALHNFVSLAQSRENIRAIISTFKTAHRPPKVYLMAMNPVHGSRAWLRSSLAAYEEAHRAVAGEEGAGFIDTRPAWMHLSDAERLRLIPDGLHPDPREDAKVIVPALVRSLAGSECRQEAEPWRH